MPNISQNHEEEFYQNTIRVLFILYFFSEAHSDSQKTELVKVFHSEVRIQKIDFLLRYPSYLCDELMNLIDKDESLRSEITKEIENILNSNEPKLKTKEMQRFFFGAYDKLDEIIAFLWGYGFIKFDSKRRLDMKQHQKTYYITKYGQEKIDDGLTKLPALGWYVKRCKLIKRYFGDLTGTELKEMQYEHPEYRKANWNELIRDIETRVRTRFQQNYKTQA
jgi:hypothetical protein